MATQLINLSDGSVVKSSATTADLVAGCALMDTVRHKYDATERAIKPRPISEQITMLIERQIVLEDRVKKLETARQ